MSRETERAMKEMQAFLEQYDTENMTMEEVNELLRKHVDEYNNNLPERVTEKTAKTADDFIELAEEAESASKAFIYAQKALELEPDNLDAERIMIENSAADVMDLLKKLKRAVKRGTDIMEREGYMDDESIGNYWGMIETRPYMRLREMYMTYLRNCGMMKRAAEECEEMIRLCENDNLGARYTLMHIYAYLEEEEPALALQKKFDGRGETQMLMPLSILYYKLGDLDKAEQYIKKLSRVNKDLKKLMKSISTGDSEIFSRESLSEYGYRPFTIEELMVEMMENEFLFKSVPLFFQWADSVLRKKR